LKKQYYFITGLPRTGSTLLTSILSQNSDIYAAGNSPVSQMMYDMHISVTEHCDEQFEALGLDGSEHVSNIIKNFYSRTKSKYVFDKCRGWGKKEFIPIIEKYIDPQPKFIVLLRPIIEIFSSFVHLAENNQIYDQSEYRNILFDNDELIMGSYLSVINLIENHFDKCLFIFYDEIVNDTKNVIYKIYDFCDIRSEYDHYFTNIKNKYPENDEAYGLLGMHDIRPSIKKRIYDVNIQDQSLKYVCENMYSSLLSKYSYKQIINN